MTSHLMRLYEALTNHLTGYVKRLAKEVKQLILERLDTFMLAFNMNKTLSSFEFSNWEHIDFENSDL